MTISPWRVAGCALLGAVLAGCASPAAPAPPAAPPPSSPAPTSAPPTGPTPVAAPTSSVSGNASPPATAPTGTPVKPGTVPVQRPGETPVADRVKGTTGTLTRPVEYRDGLRVEIVRATSGVVTDVGPGALTGAPYRLFTVRFRNDTARPIDLSQVVLAAYYGKDQQAQPVYFGDLEDFTGTVATGGSMERRYAFSIPTGEKGPVTLTVDFDSLHAVAVFRNTGSA